MSERSQAGLVMDESAEAHLSFLVVMQDLQCVYSVHRQGLGSAGIVAVLQVGPLGTILCIYVRHHTTLVCTILCTYCIYIYSSSLFALLFAAHE